MALVGLSIGTGPAWANENPAGPDNFDAAKTDALCARVQHAEPPAADKPTAAQRQALAHCDGEALLYGIGRPVDVAQARLCGVVQQASAGPKELSGLFDGAGLLITIYANGLGVPRNRAVAAHLACTAIWTAEMEREGRVPHLLGLIHSKYYRASFSPCDDITSGLEEGVCAAHDARVADVARSARISAFARRLPETAAARFTTLRKAQAVWAHSRGDDEIDQTGTDRVAVTIAETEKQDDDFAAMLDRLGKSPPPRLGGSQLHEAGMRMDAALRKLLAAPPPDPDMHGAVTPAGIRQAQQAWTRYRDAWGAFAAVAYPAWGSDGAEAWVTMKRADMLEHMLPPAGTAP